MKPTAEQLTLRSLHALLGAVDRDGGTEWLRDVIAERLQEDDAERETDIAPPTCLGAAELSRWDVQRWGNLTMQRLVQIADDEGAACDESEAAQQAVAQWTRAYSRFMRAIDNRNRGTADELAVVELLARTLILARVVLKM